MPKIFRIYPPWNSQLAPEMDGWKMIFSFLGFSLFSEAFAVRFRAISLIWVSVSEKDHLVRLTNALQNVTTIFNITKFPTPTKINTVLLLLLLVVVVAALDKFKWNLVTLSRGNATIFPAWMVNLWVPRADRPSLFESATHLSWH